MKKAIALVAVAGLVSCEKPRVRKLKKRAPPVVSAPREKPAPRLPVEPPAPPPRVEEKKPPPVPAVAGPSSEMKMWPPEEGEWLFEKRWVYCSFNLLVDKNADELVNVMDRARAAGYTGILLADYKFNKLGQMIPRYFRNVERVREKARGLGLGIIPACFPIGYSNGLLSHDPNLAAGLPVRDALFVVKDGVARPVADPPIQFRNGDFEEVRGDTCLHYRFQDGPGEWSFSDTDVVKSGKRSLRFEEIGRREPRHGHGRICQYVKVEPFRCYRFSVWVRTRDFEAARKVKVAVLVPGKSLSYQDLNVKRTQDWTEHAVVFNSLDHDEVRIYMGVWGGKGGRLWFDGARLEEAGLLNILRREGAPLLVKGEDGTVYEEGRDFEPVRDPRLGRTPWAGEYEVMHAPPEGIRLAPGSRIRDGERLRVSYYHPVIIHGGQVSCCVSEPKVYRILRDQAERLTALFRPKAMFMSHDEIRCLGWDKACTDRGMSSGEILAECVRKCVEIIEEVNPGCEIYVWSDMFDPNHNARGDYYLVRGDLAGSWEGLSADVIIANWHDKDGRGLRHFQARGHRQLIAGYYDGSPPKNLAAWYGKARGVRGVIGCMYTTWRRDYSRLEEFARLMKRGELQK